MPSFERPIINMKKYKDFKVAISQVPPMDMAFKEMAINDYELLVATIYMLNDLIEVHNKYTEKIDEILEWLLNEGLTVEVTNKLIEWLNDGTLENLINDTLFESKLDKTEFETFKLQLNQTLNDLTQTLTQNINDVQQNLTDNINLINQKYDNKLNQLVINVKYFGATGDYSPENQTNDVQAFKEAISFLENKNGGVLYIPNGNYNIADTQRLLVDVNNVTVLGESLDVNLLNNGLRIKKARNVTFKNLTIKPNSKWIVGITANSSGEEILSKNIIIDNVHVFNCYDGFLFYKTKGNITVTNTHVETASRIGITFDNVDGSYYCVNNYVYDSKQGIHVENCQPYGVIKDNILETIGLHSSNPLPNSDQPDVYAGGILLAGSENITIENNILFDTTKSNLIGGLENIKLISNTNLKLVCESNPSKPIIDIDITGNNNSSLYAEGDTTFNGKLNIENNKGGSFTQIKGDLQFVSIKNNDIGRLLVISENENAVGFLQNNRITSPNFSVFNLNYINIDSLTIKSTSNVGYPDHVGMRIDGSIVKSANLDNLNIEKGSKIGNHIVLHGDKIDNLIIGSYNKNGVNSAINYGPNNNNVKRIQLYGVGNTNNRPSNISNGFTYFDTTVNKPIWWNGSKWVNSQGGDV